MSQPYLMSLLFVLGLLGAGFALRAGLRPLRTLFVPASVVGGLLGLCVMQAGLRVGEAKVINHFGDVVIHDELTVVYEPTETGKSHERLDSREKVDYLYAFHPQARGKGKSLMTQRLFADIANTINPWPGLLIAVVFAGLLIERPGKTFREAMVRASRQGVVAWIVILGEVFVGLLAVALLVRPFYPELPLPFGQLIETGFAGGHGTAAAMGSLFTDTYNFPAGRDLAFLFATVGLVYGVVSGIFFVNLGVRRGWLRRVPVAAEAYDDPVLRYESRQQETTAIEIPVVSGLENRHNPPPSAFARVRSEVIDPLAFQLVILAAAFAAGFALQQSFLWLASVAAPTRWYEYVDKIPLFLFTLLGGWVVRELMHVCRVGDLIDPPSIHRLTGIAMEILIVAALTNLRIEAAAQYLWPVLLLLGVGFAWTAFCLVYVSPKLLPRDYWFELGLLNYGMSTATTAQGILLLRIVDRDLESGAAEDYAAAAPLSAPFIGGGVLTVLGFPLLLKAWGGWPVVILLALVLVGLWFVGLRLAAADQSN